MDRTAFGWNRNGKQEQGAHSMALVHSLLLHRGGRHHLRSHLTVRVSSAQAPWGHRPDRHALPDWNRALREDAPRSRSSTIPSGNSSLALRRGGIAGIDPFRLDSPVAVPRQVSRLLSVQARKDVAGYLAGLQVLKPNGR